MLQQSDSFARDCRPHPSHSRVLLVLVATLQHQDETLWMWRLPVGIASCTQLCYLLGAAGVTLSEENEDCLCMDER